jgi:o-succinylbenzoate synthase
MMQAKFTKHTLQFIISGGTSRGVLQEKDSWFIQVWNNENPSVVGVGECSIIPRLSFDDKPELERQIADTVCRVDEIQTSFQQELKAWPSIRFALETALLDLQHGGLRVLYPSPFTQGKESIPINGLIWMGDFDFMWHQAEKKFKSGFNVLKMKVGALDFDEEIYFIKQLRNAFPQAELRLDANGGFPPEEALERLKALAGFNIHSIEQPIKAGNIARMANLCLSTPIPIALDEELIGIHETVDKERLLAAIRPQYIILKPSLVGGFQASEEWISIAGNHNIRWWATSALEANIGLNAIAQWAFTKNNALPQGLGTGSLYHNNIQSPLVVADGRLYYKPDLSWGTI